MTAARIWRAGDAPLAPGTRVRALKVDYVPDAEGLIGEVARSFKLADNGEIVVDFGRLVPSFSGTPDTWWCVKELEVLDDGGEQ